MSKTVKKKVIEVYCETESANNVIRMSRNTGWGAVFFDERSHIMYATRKKLSNRDRLFRITIERIHPPQKGKHK